MWGVVICQQALCQDQVRCQIYFVKDQGTKQTAANESMCSAQ